MSDAPTTEFWHVQLPSGEVRYYSLEELDASFQRDEIDAKTYVLKEGTTTWQRLGELLGLEEAGASVAASSDLISVPVEPYRIGGIAASPQIATGEFHPPSTMRPVATDVADLDDERLVASMRPRKKNVAAMAGGALVALALLIVGISRAASSDDATAAATQPPPAASPLPASTPEPVAPTPAATLSDDVKQKLLEADKAREAKAAARAAENAKRSSSLSAYRTPKSGSVFHKGGNQYDPLNSGN